VDKPAKSQKLHFIEKKKKHAQIYAIKMRNFGINRKNTQIDSALFA